MCNYIIMENLTIESRVKKALRLHGEISPEKYIYLIEQTIDENGANKFHFHAPSKKKQKGMNLFATISSEPICVFFSFFLPALSFFIGIIFLLLKSINNKKTTISFHSREIDDMYQIDSTLHVIRQ